MNRNTIRRIVDFLTLFTLCWITVLFIDYSLYSLYTFKGCNDCKALNREVRQARQERKTANGRLEVMRRAVLYLSQSVNKEHPEIIIAKAGDRYELVGIADICGEKCHGGKNESIR